MKRIAVISGGTGFIGQRLGVALARDGWTVRVLCRQPDRTRGTLAYPAELHAWERDYGVRAETLEGAEAIFHLAGESIASGRWSAQRKNAILTSRERSTQRLVDAVTRMATPPRVFVQTSAVGYYGDRGNEDLTEESSSGEDFLADVCRRWEQAGPSLAKNGVRWVALRTGVVFGLEGGAFPRLNTLYTAGLGANLGGGAQWMSWIHIDDWVAIARYVLANEQIQGPVNAVAPNPVRFRDLHDLMVHGTHAPFALPAPALPLRLALGEQSAVLLGSQRAIPAVLENTDFTFRFKRVDEATAGLFAELTGRGVNFLFRQQWVDASLVDLWRFFSDETNLEVLTPPTLTFRVLGKSTREVRKGTRIRYQLRLHRIPLTWESEITLWDKERAFVDEQVKGPYHAWHHLHRFEALQGGVLLTDLVSYRLPFGLLGKWGGGLLVDRDLTRIFAFRQKVIGDRFSVRDGKPV